MNSASWKSVTYCRTVGKETQKILFNSQNCNFIVKLSGMKKFSATEENVCHSLCKGHCLLKLLFPSP